MDVFMFLFMAVVSFLLGVIAAVATMIYFYLLQSPIVERHKRKNATISDYILPETLKSQIELEENNEKPREKQANESALPISLLLQFLFQELRHSDAIKHWVYRKLSMEFEELLSRTTIGKFFDAIKIEDIDFGNQFPEIRDISLEEIQLEPKDYIDNVTLCLNIDYKGNFLLSIDGKMKFGRSAYLSIRVKRVSGPVRLQFSRHPYTHWSFGFKGDPSIDLEVESHFQGRQLQSHITNLIVNQIKRTIKRRHTLPNYKIRYKPFFVKTDPGQLDYNLDDNEIRPNGLLKMNVIEVTRLDVSCVNNDILHSIYCTFALDVIPWLYYHERNAKFYIVLEITVPKLLKNVHLETTLKQTDTNAVAIETLVPDGDLQRAGLKIDDVILAVDNKPVTNSNQLSKLLRSVVASHVTLRIERAAKLSNVSVAMETSIEDNNEMTVVQQRTPSKLAQSLGNLTFRRRRRSLGDVKTSSPQKQPPAPEIKSDCNDIHKTIEMEMSNMLKFNQDFQFILNKPELKYLNVNVWGRHQEKTTLLGYLNVPLGHILNECGNSVLGYYRRRYSLLPPPTCQPTRSHPLASHSGFEQVFCYGDVLLTFAWSRDDDVDSGRRKMSSAVIATDQQQLQTDKQLKKHDFIRTQFNRTTHCDFCSKKIWLKDAVQCQQCDLCCHKKCVVKCQTATECVPNGGNEKNAANKPEIITSEAVWNDTDTPNKCYESGLANQGNSLSIPGFHNQSKSLPPSPQRTPNRKPSIVQADPFVLCPGALEEVHKQPLQATKVIVRLLEQVLMCHSDEALMENAKKSGNDLYTSMNQEERTEKINIMMTELRKVLDEVTLEHLELSKQLATEESEVEKTKVAFLMGQADAKVHALSALMLHYCSSLQRSQEKIV